MFEFLQSISDFFTTGIYEFFTEAAKYLTTTVVIWYIKAQIWSLTFAWEVGSSVIANLNLMSQVNSAMGLLPAQVSSGINFFRVPEAINMLLTAGATRLVMNLVPGL